MLGEVLANVIYASLWVDHAELHDRIRFDHTVAAVGGTYHRTSARRTPKVGCAWGFGRSQRNVADTTVDAVSSALFKR